MLGVSLPFSDATLYRLAPQVRVELAHLERGHTPVGARKGGSSADEPVGDLELLDASTGGTGDRRDSVPSVVRLPGCLRLVPPVAINDNVVVTSGAQQPLPLDHPGGTRMVVTSGP